MVREQVTGIQPAILLWARKSAGLAVADVARSLKRPEADIEAWEAGASAPSYAQLEKLAYQLYRRPLAVFFLPAPPEEVMPQREFRTLPETDLQTLAPDTCMHIRRAHAHQLSLRELFDSTSPSERRIWQSVRISSSVDIATQAQKIREFLGVRLDEQIKWKSDETALKKWRQAVESSGVFVFKAPFKQKDISGFCLMDEQFPLIYINNSTSKTRQTFSLMHELAHLLLQVNGLSKFDSSYIQRLTQSEQQIEQTCNAIAAETLIPNSDFWTQAKLFPADIEKASEEQFSELASRYGVSREAVLRRFLDGGRVSSKFYELKAKQWSSQKTQKPGGDWYSNQGAYLSDRFAKEVVGRHFKHQISLEQAADFLGVKPKHYAGIEERVLGGSGS
ncbi:MAG: ImmA/IrrE family metallo-endopeptidase [Rhodocyclaceae bacterium]